MAKPQTTTFESILDTPAADVERPQPMPIGTYDGVVKGLYEQGESSQKKTPFVRFTYTFLAALDDVDEEELTTLLTDKDGNVHALNEKTIRDTYYTTPDAMFRLTDTLENMGVIDPDDDDGKTIRQALADTPNCAVRFQVSHRASEDGLSKFAEVKRTLKPE